MKNLNEYMEVVILDNEGCHRGKRVQAGDVYVDGSRIGDIGSVVIKDRKLMSKDGVLHKTSVGGQALIEGVMMNGPKGAVISVRHTDGHIITEMSEVKHAKDKYIDLKVYMFTYLNKISRKESQVGVINRSNC